MLAIIALARDDLECSLWRFRPGGPNPGTYLVSAWSGPSVARTSRPIRITARKGDRLRASGSSIYAATFRAWRAFSCRTFRAILKRRLRPHRCTVSRHIAHRSGLMWCVICRRFSCFSVSI